MKYRVLGPLEVRDGDRSLPLAGAKQRALLALLLVNANRVLSRDRLIDELWGAEPPETAVQSLQVYVSRLRKLLPSDTLLTRPPGYLLEVEPDELDLERFERMLADGRVALAQGDPERASDVLHDALALWRGPALAEFAFEPFAQAEIGRLEDLRLAAVEERIDADLALGRHADLIGELEALIAGHPYRERLRGALMLALYRSGRQAEALQAYQDARRALVDELGIEPSGTLQSLEKAILIQDEQLDTPTYRGPSTTELPSGTVTFLFTDVEGSTALLARIGKDAYGELLAEHHRLIRAAVGAAGGREVDAQGEAFFAAFPSATGAVAAAVRLQRDLAAAGLRVRMGLHTGQPKIAPTGYVGLDVPRAARICAAAHGGQTLLSQATRELVEDELPDGVALRDLGEHRLKDLTSPQRLSQLVIDGLPADFPPLRTLENRPTNLPVQPTPLIGRERELVAVADSLARADLRLLTLTGPGGSGKTRLALQAAAELVESFPQGVYFVALAPIVDPALLLPTIAQTVGLKQTGTAPIAGSLKEFLSGRQLLLVLDNLEQLVDGASDLAELLAAAPGLTLLVTSRTPLHISGEHEFPVPPLALPDPEHLPELASLSQYESVALFVDRARAVKADFAVTDANAPAIAEICVQLDGLPLAIELAAARAKLLSPQALLARLEQRFELLTGGPRDRPERQQTLRATIDWSYGLLGAEEQTLSARLAVFAGGCELEAAEAVCGGDGLLPGLSTLIDSNLLRQEEQPDGEPRFTMLETIRAYALERLEASGEAEQIRRLHAEYFAAIAERAGLDFLTEPDIDLLKLERDHDNFRAALVSARARDDRELSVRLTWGLRPFWVNRGFIAEGASWNEEAVGLAEGLSPALQARAWGSAAIFAWRTGRFERARELVERALEAQRQTTDRHGEAWLLRTLGTIAGHTGDHGEAESRYEQARAIFEEVGNEKALAMTVQDMGIYAIDQREYARARALLEEGLERHRSLGSELETGNVLCDLGILTLCERRYADAGQFFAESLESLLRTGYRINVMYALPGIAAVMAAQERTEDAASLLGAAEKAHEQMGEDVQPYARKVFDEANRFVLERREEPAIAAAWVEGRAMSEADAIAFALAAVAASTKA
jgi:predicted ATPase/DNA-binding SARP family transcriptional activator